MSFLMEVLLSLSLPDVIFSKGDYNLNLLVGSYTFKYIRQKVNKYIIITNCSKRTCHLNLYQTEYFRALSLFKILLYFTRHQKPVRTSQFTAQGLNSTGFTEVSLSH